MEEEDDIVEEAGGETEPGLLCMAWGARDLGSVAGSWCFCSCVHFRRPSLINDSSSAGWTRIITSDWLVSNAPGDLVPVAPNSLWEATNTLLILQIHILHSQVMSTPSKFHLSLTKYVMLVETPHRYFTTQKPPAKQLEASQ
jgi:hypothetical protein